MGHHFARGGVRFDDARDGQDGQDGRHYKGMDAYCRSKLANVLFIRALAAREPASVLTANAVHPGWVRSRFGMDGDTKAGTGFGMRVLRPFQIGPKRGARTSIHVATSPDVEGQTGLYWVRSKPGHMSRRATADAAAQLWDQSETQIASAGFPVAARAT
jgi:NAD(P)-dependent dehydrogenase (short-subunit alcohol dehydrogenase family)